MGLTQRAAAQELLSLIQDFVCCVLGSLWSQVQQQPQQHDARGKKKRATSPVIALDGADDAAAKRPRGGSAAVADQAGAPAQPRAQSPERITLSSPGGSQENGAGAAPHEAAPTPRQATARSQRQAPPAEQQPAAAQPAPGNEQQAGAEASAGAEPATATQVQLSSSQAVHAPPPQDAAPASQQQPKQVPAAGGGPEDGALPGAAASGAMEAETPGGSLSQAGGAPQQHSGHEGGGSSSGCHRYTLQDLEHALEDIKAALGQELPLAVRATHAPPPTGHGGGGGGGGGAATAVGAAPASAQKPQAPAALTVDEVRFRRSGRARQHTP